MKSFCALALNCVVLVASSAVVAAAPPRYRLVNLGALPGGMISDATAINDAGVICGTSINAESGYPHAVAWIDGTIIDLTGLGVSGARANAVDSGGRIVGMSDSLGLNAFIWQAGKVAPLNVPFQCCSEARGINNQGQIVGFASLAGANTPNDAVLWDNETIVPLGTLGGTFAQAYAINARGQITGMSSPSNDAAYYAFVWEKGVMSPLPTFGGNWAGGLGINDSGDVVGYASHASGEQHAAAWINGEIHDLGTLGGLLSTAYGINNAGVIVGDSYIVQPIATHATVWMDGQIYDLNRLTALPPGGRLLHAYAVNSANVIVGQALLGDAARAIELIPTAPGDVNGDAAVNVSDLLAVVNSWGACPQPSQPGTCNADVSPIGGDGQVNVSDLLSVINSWGG